MASTCPRASCPLSRPAFNSSTSLHGLLKHLSTSLEGTTLPRGIEAYGTLDLPPAHDASRPFQPLHEHTTTVTAAITDVLRLCSYYQVLATDVIMHIGRARDRLRSQLSWAYHRQRRRWVESTVAQISSRARACLVCSRTMASDQLFAQAPGRSVRLPEVHAPWMDLARSLSRLRVCLSTHSLLIVWAFSLHLHAVKY